MKFDTLNRSYTFQLDENGMLESVLLEVKGSFRRELYKKNPKGMELRLTDTLFEEIVKFMIGESLFKANTIYNYLKEHDEYYASLMQMVYNKYLEDQAS